MTLRSELKNVFPRSKTVTPKPTAPSKPVRVHPTITVTESGEYFTASLASNGSVIRGVAFDRAEAISRSRALHRSRNS